MKNQFLLKPYSVGKNKKSLAMIVPSPVVKALGIDPLTIFLLLSVNGSNDLQLKIIREEDLAKKETKSMMPAEKFTRLNQQVSVSGVSSGA